MRGTSTTTKADYGPIRRGNVRLSQQPRSDFQTSHAISYEELGNSPATPKGEVVASTRWQLAKTKGLLFEEGNYVTVRREIKHTMEVRVHHQVLRILELRPSGIVSWRGVMRHASPS